MKREFQGKVIRTTLLSLVTIVIATILLVVLNNSDGNTILIISALSCVLLLLFFFFYSYKIYETRRRKFNQILETIEKAPQELTMWLRKNFDWLDWVLKTQDNKIVASFENDFDGSLSNDKLQALKLYKEFEVLYDGEWNDVDRFFRLIPSHFISPEYRRLMYQSREIEKNIEISFYAFENNHIKSQEHILTLRKQSRELIKVIYLLLNELSYLRIPSENEDTFPSREEKLINGLRKRKEFFKKISGTIELIDTVTGTTVETRDLLLEQIKKMYISTAEIKRENTLLTVETTIMAPVEITEAKPAPITDPMPVEQPRYGLFDEDKIE